MADDKFKVDLRIDSGEGVVECVRANLHTSNPSTTVRHVRRGLTDFMSEEYIEPSDAEIYKVMLDTLTALQYKLEVMEQGS